MFAAESQELAGEGRSPACSVGNLLGGGEQRGFRAQAFEKKFGIAGDHHEEIIEIVGDAAGETSDGFHLLRLLKLLFEGAPFGHVFGKKLEGFDLVSAGNSAAGNANYGGSSILAHPLDDEPVESRGAAQIIRQLEPLLRVRVKSAEMFSYEFVGGRISQHCEQGRIYLLQLAGGVAAANSVRGIGHERPEIHLRESQALLGATQRGVKPADQHGQHNEQSQPDHGGAVLGRVVLAGKREIRADGEGEGSGDQPRLPAAIPGANHHGDGKHGQPAFCDVREQQNGNQRERGAEYSYAVAQNGRTGRLNAK